MRMRVDDKILERQVIKEAVWRLANVMRMDRLVESPPPLRFRLLTSRHTVSSNLAVQEAQRWPKLSHQSV